MSRVAIVTDTISCLPPEMVKEYDIHIIPVGLVIDRKVYLDNAISNEEFWRLFYQAKESVTTNAANPADFEALFTRLAAQTDGICCILVSKQLSATFNMAAKARDTVQLKFPGLKIEIIDSRTATGAQGYIVRAAAQAAREGKALDAVAHTALDMVSRVKFLTVMQTLKYLIKSGRAPKAAIIGKWLNVKPLIGMVSGSGLVDSLGKERGMDKAIAKIIDRVKDYADTTKPLHIMVHYTDDKALGESVKEKVASLYHCSEIYLTPYTPVMASQTGPVIAIAFYADK
jgi:DegV family protein with EDD domain